MVKFEKGNRYYCTQSITIGRTTFFKRGEVYECWSDGFLRTQSKNCGVDIENSTTGFRVESSRFKLHKSNKEMVKISTTIAIEAGKEYTCIKDGNFKGLDFIKGRIYRGVLAGKLQIVEGGRHVDVDECFFELYEPVEHLCIKEVPGGECTAFIKGKKYKEIKFRNIRAETGTTWRIGEGEFYRKHFKEVQDGDTFPEHPKEKKRDLPEAKIDLGGRISGGPNVHQLAREHTTKEGSIEWPVNLGDKGKLIITPFQDPSVTFNPQKHYDNRKGSLYKIADDFGLNAYEFDILKRLTRCRKKGQFAEDLQKIKDTVDLYLLEQGGKHVQLHNRDTAGSDSTDKEPVPKQG